MGTWGTGLYSNDLAQDLRDDFRMLVRAPWKPERLLAEIALKYPSVTQVTDADYFDLRLVLADLLWTYGINHEATLQTAEGIINAGSDLAAKRSLGMREADLTRRARLLADLAQKWNTENPKPRRRRVLTEAEPFVLQVGDCLVYPTSEGKARNPYVGPRQEASQYKIHAWEADGWGSAIVLNQYHKYGVFARYVLALLASHPETRLDPEAFRGQSILHSGSFQFRTRRRVHACVTNRQHLERMQIVVVGRLEVDFERVAQEFSPTIRNFARYGDSASFDADTEGLLGRVDLDDPIAAYLVS
jgi:hypothetical protein